MDDTPFGCPVCGFTGEDEEAIKNHMVEMADDPKHQAYELEEEDKEDDDNEEDEEDMN